MNILIVHAGKGFYGGAEEVIAQLANFLVGHGHEVIVVPKDVDFNQPWMVNCKSYRQLWIAVHRCLRTGWADVINVHNFPSTLATFPTKVPIVWQCNEPPELFTNWKRIPVEAFNRWWVGHSKMKVVVADLVQTRRFVYHYGIAPTIIPYGVNYDYWSQGTRTKDSNFIILQVGHPEFFPLGRQILGEVKKDLPNAAIVQLFGKPHEEVRHWYYNADVLLHPVGEQGGWLVPFEAMCTGLPVVVSKQFTGSDLMKENNLGAVTDNYVWYIKELGKGRYEEYLNRSREWVKENLTWEKYGEGMLKVFEEAVGHD